MEVAGPGWIGPVPLQERPDFGASAVMHRFELRDGLASSHDGEPLAPMLDGVEKVSEVSSGVGRRHIGHAIRLSDMDSPSEAIRRISNLFGVAS